MKSREEYEREYKKGRSPFFETVGLWIFTVLILALIVFVIRNINM
jgi:hypothetical protein